MEALLDRGADLNVRDRMHGGTPLEWAWALGRREVHDYLKNGRPAAGSGTSEASSGTLFDLIDAGTEEEVVAMLEAGTNPNETRLVEASVSGKGVTEVEETPMQRAASSCRRSIGELLADAGAGVDLHAAAFLGRLDTVKQMLSDGASIDGRDAFGMSPLHRAIQGDAVKVVRFLIDQGADVEAHADTYTFGARAIHVAAAAGASPRMIDLLIEAGADVNQRMNPGTPLELALRNGREETAQTLRARGAAG